MKIKVFLLMVATLLVTTVVALAENCGTIDIQIGLPGPGYQSTPNPTEQSTSNLPDFIIQKLILTDTNGNEKYQFRKSEEVKMIIKVCLTIIFLFVSFN